MPADGAVMTDMRTAYAGSLILEGRANPDLVVLGADTTDSLKTAKFGKEFPDRFFNVGIAEGNLVTISAGLAASGKTVFASTYAIFLPGRAVDQIRNNVAYPSPVVDGARRDGLNVKLVASHGGLSVGPDGGSHQQLEDISIMRTIPNFAVMVPADTEAVSALTHVMAARYGPFYMRLARSKTPLVYDDDTLSTLSGAGAAGAAADADPGMAPGAAGGHGGAFEPGGAVTLRDGSDCTIAACGIAVGMALDAADSLRRDRQISCRVLDMFSVKPVDHGTLERAARDTGRILTAEEHSVIGGMGSAVAESVSESYPVPVKRIGVADAFGESARDGEVPLLLKKHGITPFNMAQEATALVKRPSQQ